VKGIVAEVALAAALAGAVAAALWRRRAAATAATRQWSCGCGQAYRVSGIDRHRIYWPAGETDPVLHGGCVSCGAPLPAEHERVAA